MWKDTDVLLVIDVQNDFCPGGALAVTGGDAIVAKINALMADFDLIIFRSCVNCCWVLMVIGRL